MDERDVREQHTEDLIQVRRVTQMHAAWTEAQRERDVRSGPQGTHVQQRRQLKVCCPVRWSLG